MSKINVFRSGSSVILKVDGKTYSLTPDQAKSLARGLKSTANMAIDSSEEDTQGEKYRSDRP